MTSENNYSALAALERIANIDIFDESCEGHQALEKIANKWTILIIYALTQGTKRYGELKQQIKGISPKMLIQNLRNLERCGLVERKVFPVVPPKVDYSLTPLGKSLVEPLAIFGEWSYIHIHEVKAACSRYESQPDSIELKLK
ncbi:helix-turn-helix transcriptional regulator [Plectonema cf. radiosum LEGE 06105]|uniref:Helix-turn-helix transcriptional regulator n=1 Tax=Plectonema cf. radiosum LEGE 06105 TaxID=945769 RepID=A0A8J7F495_9CYAN|nr:helix-turn-helix domain-containing protein [Plectonema radiosum]MBE9212139.1 helix-turn-helix transcriptional regulator [Plectonema cf. radiosum LEGE 06105]